METFYPDGFLLQQDNAKSNTSRQTIKWLDDNEINILKGPASSPDLIYPENLQDITKNKVEKAGNNTVKEWKEDSIKM